MSGYELADVTVKRALLWNAEHHRHLPEVQGGLFAIGVRYAGEIVGVAIAANPARVWQGTGRFVIARCAALPGLPGHGAHAAPVCTMLYSSLCRAGAALAYREAWTYTLPNEDGRSILAAGFSFMGWTRAGEWSRAKRPRPAAVCADRKGRWARGLTRV